MSHLSRSLRTEVGGKPPTEYFEVEKLGDTLFWGERGFCVAHPTIHRLPGFVKKILVFWKDGHEPTFERLDFLDCDKMLAAKLENDNLASEVSDSDTRCLIFYLK
jgi:hypothetical protein